MDFNALLRANVAAADALDQFDLAAWRDAFLPNAVYRAQARENFDRSLPLAAIYLDGWGMMNDRITAIEKTLVFSPRSIRHVLSAAHVVSETANIVCTRTSFSIFQSLNGAMPEILALGCYHDEWVSSEGAPRIVKRTAVYDNALIPNSLVYPL
jgi:3-phenylpropionate/cinnamic acid dioxygenase small subunit